jgi:hypothetical protein
MTKIIHVLTILMTTLFLVPPGAVAQDDFSPYGPERSRDWHRGEIQVTNDWRDPVKVTMWTHQRERIGDYWMIEPGESAFLAIDEDRIRVRPNYKIKVGKDWGWVDLESVGQFHRGAWYVNVRDIWRATHPRGDGRRSGWDSDEDEDEDVPDWRR